MRTTDIWSLSVREVVGSQQYARIANCPIPFLIILSQVLDGALRGKMGTIGVKLSNVESIQDVRNAITQTIHKGWVGATTVELGDALKISSKRAPQVIPTIILEITELNSDSVVHDAATVIKRLVSDLRSRAELSCYAVPLNLSSFLMIGRVKY